MRGRRLSYLLGTLTLAVSTLLYLLMWRIAAPFWAWALASVLLGLGFTFFSGAVQAWLVDALKAGATTARSSRSSPTARSSRAWRCSADRSRGGTSRRSPTSACRTCFARRCWRSVSRRVPAHARRRLHAQTRWRQRSGRRGTSCAAPSSYGFGNRPVRWVMLAAPFTDGVSIYAFYAMQPYLLELYGDPKSLWRRRPGGRHRRRRADRRRPAGAATLGRWFAGGRPLLLGAIVAQRVSRSR